MITRRIPVIVLAVTTLILTAAYAQPPGGGRGRFGQGFGRAGDERFQTDRNDFQFLLRNHQKITRTVKPIPGGVETITESDDPAVAAKIKEHTKWMKVRIDQSRPIRMRDPLFRELFRHTDKIAMERVETDKGVHVIETSEDPYVSQLIRAHAKVVSGFVTRGFDEATKNHPVPVKNQGTNLSTPHEYVYPRIENYGKVVPLPAAAEQPRANSKIVVDITAGGDRKKLNPAIEKVCRFVNIYAGAGKDPVNVDIAIVLHGDATLDVLNVDAFERRFGVAGNPNLDCLRELHEAGVEILVCGQSLHAKNAKPDEVVVFADVAVSALTALVNLQADGYAYIPLK